MSGKYAVRFVAAPNDGNGNPRRGWMVYGPHGPDGSPVAFIDHGYAGRQALRDALGLDWADLSQPDPLDSAVSEPHRIDMEHPITAAEYAQLRRLPSAFQQQSS